MKFNLLYILTLATAFTFSSCGGDSENGNDKIAETGCSLVKAYEAYQANNSEENKKAWVAKIDAYGAMIREGKLDETEVKEKVRESCGQASADLITEAILRP